MFLGKGGAGKTTLAAATALTDARTDGSVLLVSIDQAHSLADVLAVDAGSGLTSVTDGLDILEIDSLGLLEQRYATLHRLASFTGGHEHAGQFDLPAPEELIGLPAAQELLALTEVARLAADGRWRTVIVDAPASADAFRLIASPRTFADYMDRIWPQHSRIAAATGSDPRLMLVVALYDRILGGLGALRDLLDDRTRTGATLVTTPDRAGFAELRRLRSWTAMATLRLDAVIVNGLVPDLGDDGPAAEWVAAVRAAQSAVVDEIRALVTETPVVVYERRSDEPIGLRALGEMTQHHRHDRDPSRLGSDVEPVRIGHDTGTGVDAVYTMRMHLPVADPSSLTLGRVADDLVVGADGIRRRLRLASGLRRCTVSEAEFDGTDLLLRFVPDPAVWPK
ncbi:MAG TPA: ArsA-related P-loop ATPase [Rhodococcus sp. (in: high G+C Gram-positive bacteria)]|nr:ArsA-related P-loop ATPase [Rhodococcus sp. (in: high G+C Gram-positive bacteria)]